MKAYFNCSAYHTGIYPAHTLDLSGRLVSIVRGDASAVVGHYTQRGLELHGTATDNAGNKYTIYTDSDDVTAPGARVIAVPCIGRGCKGGVNA